MPFCSVSHDTSAATYGPTQLPSGLVSRTFCIFLHAAFKYSTVNKHCILHLCFGQLFPLFLLMTVDILAISDLSKLACFPVDLIRAHLFRVHMTETGYEDGLLRSTVLLLFDTHQAAEHFHFCSNRSQY